MLGSSTSFKVGQGFGLCLKDIDNSVIQNVCVGSKQQVLLKVLLRGLNAFLLSEFQTFFCCNFWRAFKTCHKWYQCCLLSFYWSQCHCFNTKPFGSIYSQESWEILENFALFHTCFSFNISDQYLHRHELWHLKNNVLTLS